MTHSNDSVQVSSDSGQCSAGDVDEPQTTENAVNQHQHPFSTETERPLHLTSGNSNAITSSDDSDGPPGHEQSPVALLCAAQQAAPALAWAHLRGCLAARWLGEMVWHLLFLLARAL